MKTIRGPATIKALAKRYKKSRVDLAFETGLSLNTVIKYLNGRIVNRSTDKSFEMWAIIQEGRGHKRG